ncbi:glycoside hydrolase family 25 protein [Actinomadura sp. HBU206391]|uniref:glycoside hydrolase family 25 protein n=1 Tax=Actinomadura sp. HBU206391 TaxID=2731692 RepID=UPI00164FB2B4|nr:glycoside hydrolase family 25 protein [Actinomadura sp. HBU206391]MBC6460982.1 glycoside hydrolase family 25 protein [Actinomadura sp. HBU206391]
MASYQGEPDWQKVHGGGIRFAFSKVTESTNYTNPTWSHNRAAMLALSDFLPGGYHFLHGGNGAAQAGYFLSKAGDLGGFAVALDVEASGANAATARDWVAEFKQRTGGHPVIGYYPRWYWEQTGRPDLSFFDSVWQSHYVSGSGSPGSLYGKVPADWWATFGGEPISILQYSSSASVPGISGRCDVNAYRGTLAQLRTLALGDEMSAKDVWEYEIDTGDGGPKWRAESILGHLEKAQDETNAMLKEALARLGGLEARVTSIEGRKRDG